MAPASRTHAALQNELGSLIRNHLAERSSLCSVLANPSVVPRVQAEHNVRIPDLAVICSEYEAEEPVVADPVLIVEISRQATRPKPGPMFGPIRRFQASEKSSFSGPFRLAPIFCAAARMAPGQGRRKQSRRGIWSLKASDSGRRCQLSTGPHALPASPAARTAEGRDIPACLAKVSADRGQTPYKTSDSGPTLNLLRPALAHVGWHSGGRGRALLA